MTLLEYAEELHALREKQLHIERMIGKPTTEELLQLRPFVEKWLAEYPQATPSLWEIFRAIECGDVAVLKIHANLELQAVCFIEYINRNNSRTLHVLGIAGAMLDDWLETLLDELDYLASGCDSITLAGRPGWLKKLRHNGFNHVFSMMSKKMAG